jgi:hypothetical protein
MGAIAYIFVRVRSMQLCGQRVQRGLARLAESLLKAQAWSEFAFGPRLLAELQVVFTLFV